MATTYYTVSILNLGNVVFDGQFMVNGGVIQILTDYATDASTNILAAIGSIRGNDNAYPVTANGIGFQTFIKYNDVSYNYLRWNNNQYQLGDVAQIAPINVDISFVQVQNLFNKSYVFAGTPSSYIAVPANDALILSTNDFTIEWWQYQTDSNPFPRVFQVGNYGGGGGGTVIGVSIEGGTFYYWSYGQNAHSFGNLNAGGYKNQWVHFALCRYNRVTKLFKNGTQFGTDFADNSNMPNIGAALTIGNESNPQSISSYGGYIYGFVFQKGVALYTGTSFTQLAIYNPNNAALLLYGNNSLGYWGLDASLNNVTTTYDIPNPLFHTRFPGGFFSAVLPTPPAPPPLVPTSNTCFPANTYIRVDHHGALPIQLLDKRVHTIRGRKIVAVTQVVLETDGLIQVERGALGPNMPDRDTRVSANHGILFHGALVKARHLDGGKRVPYNGEVLYNVLLEKPGKMVANNMVVETLHPDNGIARLYRDLQFDELSSQNKRHVLHEIQQRRSNRRL